MRQVIRLCLYFGILLSSILPMACGQAPPIKSCNPGTEGCACDNGKCNNGLACSKGVCASFCTKLNCDCSASLKCDDGLVCERGFCSKPPCTQKENCRCGTNGECDKDLVCERGYCVLPVCTLKENCRCGRKGECDKGLQCTRGYCEKPNDTKEPDPICGDGKDNCRCDQSGGCKSPSFRCYRGFCTSKDEIPGAGSCKAGLTHCPCKENAGCDDSKAVCRRGYCEPKPPVQDCTGTKANCPCRQDGTCDKPLTCIRGFCESVCTKEGCQCYRNGKCDAGLVCQVGYCTKPEKAPQDCTKPIAGCRCAQGKCETGNSCVRGYCEPGTGCTSTDTGKKGCPCKTDGSCNTDLACGSSGRCFECKSGTKGCPCRSGGGSNSCDANLKCKSNVCLPCDGETDCPCLTNDRCLPGLKCSTKGTQKQCTTCTGELTGCSCRESADCLTKGLVCLGGFCRKDLSNNPNGRCTPTVPKNPICYSPCSKDIQQQDGSILFCHSKYKLAEGCLNKQTCTKGSCVVNGQSTSTGYPNCKADTDCPNWQACIQGRCYSNCKNDADCCGGMKCYRYVCRLACSTTSSVCNKDEVCETVSQNKGYCVPRTKPNPSVKPQRRNVGTFTVNKSLLEFTNYTLELEFSITNNSRYPRSFVITRVSDSIPRNATAKNPPHPLNWHLFAVCARMDSKKEKCVQYDSFGPKDKPYMISSIGKGERKFVKVKIDASKLPTKDFDKGLPVNQYQGRFMITGQQMGDQEVTLTYRQTGDGQWSGTMYSFANFDDANLGINGNITNVNNAFIRKWSLFKASNMSLEEFNAILTSIQKGTWNLKPVIKKCEQLLGVGKRCFPFKNSNGIKELTDSLSQRPIPSASTDMNLTINLKEKKAKDGSYSLEGQIDTDRSLQYPGNAKIRITFDGKPGGTTQQGKAIQLVKSFNAKVFLGGRYAIQPSGSCNAALFNQALIPWLVPGFEMGSYEDSKRGMRFKKECRSNNFPFGKLTNNKPDPNLIAKNASLSQANPIPNGLILQREIELVDGALIFNRYLFIIYRERFKSFFNTGGSQNKNNPLNQDFVNYGYVMLTRAAADLEPADLIGFEPGYTECPKNSCKSGESCVNGICQISDQLKQVSCSADVMKKALNTTDNVGKVAANGQLATLVNVLLDGVPKNNSTRTLDSTKKANEIHYYCEDTDQFDGGPQSDPCPVGSKVVFFRYNDTTRKQRLKQDDCNTNASKKCFPILTALRRNTGYTEDPTKVCNGKFTNQAYCDEDRTDLTRYYDFKEAVKPKGFVSPYQSLRAAIADAFRYRIKFRSRTGKQIGFTPEICVPKSNAVPYCYAPKVIEQIEQRVNCLQAIYTTSTLVSKLDQSTKTRLREFLKFAFSFDDTRKNTNGEKITDLGFETLNAELKIMLGDDAFVKASASRFDLAGSNLYSFYGDLLEPNGLQLSGALGYEMHNLYLATQYYQMVLDRFFSSASVMHESFKGNFSDWFITPKSITSYFQKLIRASTNKARAWSEIAKRYHKLRQPELARHVARRAYTASFIESIILNRLMRALLRATAGQEFAKLLPQIQQELERASLTYKASFLDFNNVYRDLLNDINIFGFSLDYIPFPAVENSANNAFKVAFDFAKQKMLTAKEKERLALQNQRSFDVDNVSFQNELIKIEQNYENQLVDICGTITDPSTGKKYPAIAKYVYLSTRAAELGDPCGWMGSGQLYNARQSLGQARISFQSLKVMQKNTLQKIEIEKQRIKAQCDKSWELHKFIWDVRGKQNDLQKQIRSSQDIITAANRAYESLAKMANLAKCTPPTAGTSVSLGNCITAGIQISILEVADKARGLTVAVLEKKIQKKQIEIADLNQTIAAKEYQIQCGPGGLRRIESAVRIRDLRNSMLNHELEALKSHYNIRIVLSNIKQLEDKAKRLVAQQDESAQLAINLQAAKNDPNVRIYKNDSILTAESTFDIAMREAYRTTLVYEYFTGSSYKEKIKLFLIRMISSGTYNLEDYLTKLELAYREFLENNGVPDTRVAVYSLRDDILKISRTGKDGKPLTITERINAFRKELTKTSRLNSEGYLSFPFDISVDKGSSKVSPITVNHKIFYVESEIIGGDVGDSTGRLYLRQKGTSWVRLPANKFEYYTLPQRIAVLNPFFNGVKSFTPTVYQNYRLRDRPLANSHWELLLNQLSEQVNQDIDLNSLDDIRLYIYYKDFTEGN